MGGDPLQPLLMFVRRLLMPRAEELGLGCPTPHRVVDGINTKDFRGTNPDPDPHALRKLGSLPRLCLGLQLNTLYLLSLIFAFICSV